MDGPFDLSAALEAGLTRGQLRGPGYRRLGRCVYLAGREATLRDHCRAALLVLPEDAVIIGVTALHLWGVELGEPLPVRTVTASGSHRRRPEIRVVRGRAVPTSTKRVALPALAWVSAAADLDLVDLVAAGDWLVRRRRVTVEKLRAAAATSAGRHCRVVRRAADLVRERVDSPRETRLRLALVLAGLPEPRTNVVLGSEDGPVGRVDLLYDAYRLILEYDGDQHRSDRDQWNTDLNRDDFFTDEGFRVLRMTNARMRRAREVVLRVYRALVERGYAGPVPVFDAEWRALFER